MFPTGLRLTYAALIAPRVLGLELVQLLGTAQWSVHVVGVVEQRVVDLVLAGLLAEGHHVDEPVTPEYLRGQITAACLCRHARGLDDTLCGDRRGEQ